ncbi:sensor histidine kinase [Microbacterium hydrocarbonoxydans]|uniref:Oxygen sensor histidine kinase NreB n=1 Tax=Microbacterium hydrocarbonoxydans TaxID=273678 RepID=A0A1H4IU26_9MICO|nr:sensor histidine kinase [Microbacterium hydrocarbonoxydans]SEB37611.1 Signal transduction histidine kinase [Microbacterium hydrocarbonoxydans]
MSHTALTPVFVGLRTGLHALFLALTGVVIARALLDPSEWSVPAVVLALIIAATYGSGVLLARLPGGRRLVSLSWLALLSVEWLILLWVSADAAYLVFPLFFLFLHLLGRWLGSIAILVSTIVAVIALGIHGGWSVGGVVGPFVGAGVALLIGLGYQALATEAQQREALVSELLATRGQLAAREHESGVLAERARLAREIHDTLAQGLSSIQMLLHAAERADDTRPGTEHIRLARETAAANLAEARRFIRELTPPQLDDQTLGAALRRLARTQWATQGLDVQVRVSDAMVLPMHLQTALLRITQGAIANVLQHADATTATVSIRIENDRLRFTVDDDGTGFDAALPEPGAAQKSDSFGLRATAERVQQLGGRLEIDSASGRGTTLTVDLPLTELA